MSGQTTLQAHLVIHSFKKYRTDPTRVKEKKYVRDILIFYLFLVNGPNGRRTSGCVRRTYSWFADAPPGGSTVFARIWLQCRGEVCHWCLQSWHR